MSRSTPVAIVGQACLFPGSLSVESLWENLLAGRDLLSRPDLSRWRISPPVAMGREGWNNPAGYVSGFEEIFDPGGFALSPEEVRRMPVLDQWVLHTARQAYRQVEPADTARLAIFLGNLSLPTEELAAWTESVWRGTERPPASHRFMSGLPAHRVGPALGRQAKAMALDAACASSLYAIQLACEELRSQQTDLALAGAVNRADPLFLHIGFQALQALSPSGQTRPFHKDADGLVPAEGCAFVALKRLGDAIDAGDEILGVIREVGLSNDGRSEGLLVPDGAGQVRAIRAAYEKSGIDPATISYVECHATGTARGDGTEVRSLQEAIGRRDGPLFLGSHKSNLGHAITAAGMAGLLKVLGAMRHGVLPPTLHIDDATDQIAELQETPFRLVDTAVPWELDGDEPLRAAISAFGFGGNNSHLIVEQWRPPSGHVTMAAATPAPKPHDVVVVGLGIAGNLDQSIADLRTRVLDGVTDPSHPECVTLPLQRLRFPPRDLEQSLPQQLWMLRASIDAVESVTTGHPSLPRERTGVFVGMQTDPDIVRHGVELSLPESDRFPLTAATVIGSLPNIVANRLNAHFDLAGYSFTTSAEEHSGIVALEVACDAIRRGDLEAAIVGAVEMGTHEAHQATSPPEASRMADVAVALVLKSRHLAEADGDRVLGTFGEIGLAPDVDHRTSEGPLVHSAQGLLSVVESLALPTPERLSADVMSYSTSAPSIRTHVARATRPVVLEAPVIHVVERNGVKAFIVAESQEELQTHTRSFQQYLDHGTSPGPQVFVDKRHLNPGWEPGQLAQVFPGAAAAYQGAGRRLTLGFPALVQALRERFQGVPGATAWLYSQDLSEEPTPLDKLLASSFLSQVHSEFSKAFLPDFDAAIGYSSGETNALLATGVWRDFDGLFEDFIESEAFTRHLGGAFEVLQSSWSGLLPRGESPRWETWRIVGLRERQLDAIQEAPLVHMLAVNAPCDVTLGGHGPAIGEVLRDLPQHVATRVDYDVVVHCPELEMFEDTWRTIHDRQVYETACTLYSHGTGGSYLPAQDAIGDALFLQARQTLRFPELIRRAYEDGVRVFVEHGPRGTLSSWIASILEGMPHMTVALDQHFDPSLRSLSCAVAALASAGVAVELERYNEHLLAHRPATTESRRMISLPAKRDTPGVRHSPPIASDLHLMQTPPELPSVYAAPPSSEVLSQPSGLPEYFNLQQQGFTRYLQTVARQAQVHRAFLEQVERAWHLVGPGTSEPSGPTPVPAVGIKDAGNPATETTELPGPTFHRQQLEELASGKISKIFGPIFARQDDFERQVRMPEPPLLLADRVLGIDAEPGVVGTGTIWTETDILADSWYLHHAHIPPGVMIEAGQADLLLISWMGADFENHGERIYRLLGCELTYRGGLPSAGDTLSYDIHIDGHARQGPVRLFFFHYDCRVGDDVRLSVRHGQAGFFTDEELANSGGVLWTPDDVKPRSDAQMDTPGVRPFQLPSRLKQEAVQAFADGDPGACFGTGYERLLTHTRTPTVQGGEMCLVGDVEDLSSDGGPWGRGYMRTRYELTPESWFFDGHFKNDPCMPGTLMFEGAIQVMSLYMIAMGYTLDRDGWRFEPVPDVPYELRCRGQATPENQTLIYEIFVEERVAGPQPRLVADILVTVDGLKAFHCRAMQIHLVPDVPLNEELLLHGEPQRDPRAVTVDGGIQDKLAIRATGLGPMSHCLGHRYHRFDGPARITRLPGEPFQFMTRVTSFDALPGEAKPGTQAVVEYEIPDHAWYFDQEPSGMMPFSVLLEAALQPCGWLSLNTSALLDTEDELFYRNLDGTGILSGEIGPGAGILRTETTLTKESRSGGMVIQSFFVRTFLKDDLHFQMDTTFGFFPKRALANQVGLPITSEEERWLKDSSPVLFDLSRPPVPSARDLWPGTMLRMIDEITGVWRDETLRVRAVKHVDPAEWFFQAHFFQDPVQPGSLGIEAMLQTLRCAMIMEDLHQRFEAPVFSTLAAGRELQWTYRGQVLPENQQVTVLMEVTQIVEGPEETLATADASLWVDGLKIYQARGIVGRLSQES